MLAFESYRDLVRLRCLGLSEADGLVHAERENVTLRAQVIHLLPCNLITQQPCVPNLASILASSRRRITPKQNDYGIYISTENIQILTRRRVRRQRARPRMPSDTRTRSGRGLINPRQDHQPVRNMQTGVTTNYH